MKGYIEQGLEGSQAPELLSLWSWGAPLSRHIDEFTNPETPPILYFWGFYAGFITDIINY